MFSSRHSLSRALGATLASLLFVSTLGPLGIDAGLTPTHLNARATTTHSSDSGDSATRSTDLQSSETKSRGADDEPAEIDAALTAISDAPGASRQRSASGDEAPHSPDLDPEALRNEAWVDSERGTAEMLVIFEDPGVEPAAQGDPELAADSLQRNAGGLWEQIDGALASLEREGSVTVLNRFWVTTAALVSADTNEQTLNALASLPGAREVVPNYTVEGLADETPEPMDAPSVSSGETSAALNDDEEIDITYGIEKIRADDAWRDFGVAGQGVRVAVLDTGVDATHPDIGPRLVGHDSGDPSYPGGWINFDRTGNPVVSKPTDPGSHGTHVAGTVLGGSASGTSRIGVAPEAELMAANVLSGGGSTAKIWAALEWVIEPYDGNGTRVGRAADVINMSLGSGRYDQSLITPLQNLRDAGIFPAIAIGNAPCGPNGTSSPGDIFEAFGVGMTDIEDLVNPGSCGAVTNWPAATTAQHEWPEAFVKPDASAPGTRVFSAMPNGRWGEATGTSMATPHVAGAVALLRSAQAGLTVDEIEHALETTAWHPDAASAPDTRYGHGRIDVHAAIASVIGESGISGTVVDAANGEPVAGVDVSYGPHGETWRTDAVGRFTARLAPGEYTLDATRFGYESAQTGPITVTDSGFVEISIELAPVTTGTITGTVLDASSGEPIPDATVSLMGQPVTATTDAQGAYRLDDLPVGAHRLKAQAADMREQVSSDVRVMADLETVVDFRLQPLDRVLVLGDNGARTSALLQENGFIAETLPNLPDDLSVLAGYDVVVWDAPGGADAGAVNAAISATDASGTGIVWLDLGVDDLSGIATLSNATGNPQQRDAMMDRSLSATGYRVTAEHPIFAGGPLSAESFGAGNIIAQNTATSGPKFAAWFEGLTGHSPAILAETVVQRADGDATVTEAMGGGIAVDERATNRHALLALHGSSPAVDARSWSLASTQVFVNTISWVASSSTAPEEPDGPDAPDVEEPTEPDVQPGDGGNGSVTPQHPANRGGGGSRPSASESPKLGGKPSTTTRTAASSRAPSAQAAAKPSSTPAPPVSAQSQLTSANSGGVTLREAAGIAHVTIPGAKPGDWFFLHLYPGPLEVDWIRVNDDGELRIDIANLPSGKYALAFTAEDGAFAGWVELVVGNAAIVSSTGSAGVPGVVPRGLATPETMGVSLGFTLSRAEQLLLLGAAVLLLAAACVVLLGLRRPGGKAK